MIGGKTLKINTQQDSYISAIFESYGEDLKYKTLDDIMAEYNIINSDKETLEYLAYKFHEFLNNSK